MVALMRLSDTDSCEGPPFSPLSEASTFTIPMIPMGKLRPEKI